MKRLLLLFIFLPLFSYGQSDSCASISFSEVVQVDGASQKELFERAQLWFANTFRDSKKVLEISDKDAGHVVGKGALGYHSRIFLANMATKGWVNYTIHVFVKDGRYRYQLSDFIHEANPGNEHPQDLGVVSNGFCPVRKQMMGWQRKVHLELLELSHLRATEIVTSLKEAMKAEPAEW